MRVLAVVLLLAFAGCVQSDPPPVESASAPSPDDARADKLATATPQDNASSSTQAHEGKASIGAGAMGHGGAGFDVVYMSATIPSGFDGATIVATWTAKTPASESLELVLCECKDKIEPLASAKGKSPLTLDVPKDVAPGDYHIGVFADAAAVQQEASIVLTVKLAP